jgi:DNA-directed RNA polymerase II subunit RPB1
VGIVSYKTKLNSIIEDDFSNNIRKGVSRCVDCKTIYSEKPINGKCVQCENVLEDLKVEYDMTIRTNKNKIVQFSYGDDNIDTTKVEDQSIPIVSMSTQDIYAHFLIPEEKSSIKTLGNIFLKNTLARHKKQNNQFMDKTKEYINMMITNRESIIKNVFKNRSDSNVSCPVAFSHVINNIQGQCNITISSLIDITLLEALEMIEHCFNNLTQIYYAPPTELFKTLFYYYLSPKDLLIIKRFNKAALTLLLATITIDYKRAIVAPGEMVGMIAGQSIGEVSTQMTLNTFHFAGVASKSGAVSGVPRINELLSNSKNMKTPQITIYFNDMIRSNKSEVNKIASYFKYLSIKQLLTSAEIYFNIGTDMKLKSDNTSTPFFVNNMKTDITLLPFVLD